MTGAVKVILVKAQKKRRAVDSLGLSDFPSGCDQNVGRGTAQEGCSSNV